MLEIQVLCVGKLKEDFYRDACREYEKRLGAYCRLSLIELPEAKLPRDPSGEQIRAALRQEGVQILEKLPKGGAVVALCVEGKEMDSPAFSNLVSDLAQRGGSRLTFIIGGSFGLSDEVKTRADCRLSLSVMTFPHHLARVVLLEQVYRAFQISNGGKYHK